MVIFQTSPDGLKEETVAALRLWAGPAVIVIDGVGCFQISEPRTYRSVYLKGSNEGTTG
jgi:hypothetical protein